MFTRILTSSLLFLIAIGGFFVSVDINTGTNGNTIAIMSTSQADAAGGGGTTETESKWLNEGIQFVNSALGIITVILSPIIIFAGWLMSPDWTTGDLFGLREPMHAMWVIVSNIVYFIYAILLIIIALATIFGKENFSYKSMIPKLALGILMVPFTWWFVQWTISLATVVTASVVNIPMETMMAQYGNSNEYLNKPLIPKNYTVTTLAGGTGSTTTSSKCTETNGCLSIQDILNSDGGIYNTLLIYAYNVFKIQNYKDIDSTSGKISTAGQLLNNVVISAIMLLIFGLLVMALIAMLLLRAIKLWMYAIFSPIFTLHFVAGKELFGKSTEGFDLKEFIGLCFVPAVVGLTLSFGLMIVSIVQIPSKDTTSNNNTCNMDLMVTLKETNGSYDGGCVIARLMGTTTNTIRRGVLPTGDNSDETIITDVVSMGGINIVFRGLSTNVSKSVETANTVSGAFSTAGGIFGTIIIDIIALIFIWMAFMAGKGVSKAVEAAVKPFEDMGNKVGSFAASLPKYAPLPIPGGSLAGANKAISMGENIMSARADKKFNDSGIGKLLGADKYIPDDVAESLKKIAKKPKLEGEDFDVLKAKLKFLNREHAAQSGVADEFFTQMKSVKSISELETTYRMSADEAKKVWDFMKSNESGLKTTEEKKNFGNMLNTAILSNTRSASTSSSTKPDTGTGNGTINLGGININYNGIKDLSKVDEIATKISSEIQTKASTMKQPTLDEIKAELDKMGMTSDNAESTAKKIIEAIKSSTFKKD